MESRRMEYLPITLLTVGCGAILRPYPQNTGTTRLIFKMKRFYLTPKKNNKKISSIFWPMVLDGVKDDSSKIDD